MTIRFYAVLLTALATMSCGAIEDATKDIASVRNDLTTLAPSLAPPPYKKVRVDSRPYLGLRVAPPPLPPRLPEQLLAPDAIAMPSSGDLDDHALAARLSDVIGIPVRLEGSPPDAASARPLRPAPDRLTSGSGILTTSVDTLLDTWARHAGYSWTYSPPSDTKSGEIVVTRYGTRTWTISAMVGSQTYTATSGTDQSDAAGGAGARSGQALSTTATWDPWPDLEKEMQGVLTFQHRLTVAPSTARVTLTARPADLAAARRLVHSYNRDTLRPVTVSAYVYSVRTTNETDFQIGIVAALERVMGGHASGLQLEVGRTSGSIAVVKPAPGAATTTDTLDGTLRALQRIGTVARVLSADVPSINGRPAQFFELLREAYLASITTTISETGGAETSLNPGQVASGFAMSYIARVMAPDEVLIRLFASLRDRPTFATFGAAGGDQIQLPVYADRAIQVTQRLRRGETMIISGFRDRAASTTREGTLSPHVPLPDGARRGSTTRLEQILLLRADIAAPAGVEESVLLTAGSGLGGG